MSEFEAGGNRKRRGAAAQSLAARALPRNMASLTLPWQAFERAWAEEREERRLFLWLPVCAGIGVLLYLSADTEPVLWLPLLLFSGFCAAAFALREKRLSFSIFLMLAAVSFGFLCSEFRTMRVAAPVLDRIRIARISGEIEEVDQKISGTRFLVHISRATDSQGVPLPRAITPDYVRLSSRKASNLEAGTSVNLQARLLPPAHASIPGGYDFARTAYFSRIGAVGSILGAIQVAEAPANIGWQARFMQSLDRARNALATRVNLIIGGDEGAIAAAMVAGKRTLLSENAQELIREAGIFHIITISGVQMTLVAGMIFWVTRRILSLFDVLALRYPIKKIAAIVAICGAVFYDMATGSRVGTERALFMTLIVLGSILFDRSALTMRNLGFSALAVIILEPEAITGASFQLSFAAVAALIAVHESRFKRLDETDAKPIPKKTKPTGFGLASVMDFLGRSARHIGHMLVSTLCATTATASFMANDFHDLSPYVLVGNPLTLAMIEFFAVPGALIGTLLYPLGFDSIVWLYVGLGIKAVLWMAKIIASAPGSTVHLHAFAPWALPFLSLAVLNAIIWRTWLMRLLVLPCLAVGLIGVKIGAPFDVAVPPTGDYLAFRDATGKLQIAGKHPGTFGSAQWLAADADGRLVPQAKSESQICDKIGCVAHLPDGRALSIVNAPAAFEEDCSKADIIVSGFQAPESCKAKLILDRQRLSELGATTLTYGSNTLTSERQIQTDRPWSPKPKAQIARNQVNDVSKFTQPKPENIPAAPAKPMSEQEEQDLIDQIENGTAASDL